MIFRPELAAKVMAGRKTVTRRLCSGNPRSPWWVVACALEVGRDYAVQPKRGVKAIGRVRVVGCRREVFSGWPSLMECRLEGFDTVDEFKEAWMAINGRTWDFRSEVWRVAFEVVDRG